MLIESALVTAASGSIGGMTASRNRGGMYLRAKAKPVDKFTPAQRRARQSLTNNGPKFAELSEDDRNSWQEYGAKIKVKGPLGKTVQLTAQQMFNRSSLYLKNLQESSPGLVVPVLTGAPAGSTLPAFSQSPVLDTGSEATQTVDVTFDNTEAWANEDLAFMTIWVGPGQGAGRNFFRGPWQFGIVVEGDSSTPPTSPVTVPVPFPVKVGEKVWVRIKQSRADGSVSSELVEGPLIITA